MALIIPDDILRSTGMSETELKREIAIMLFQMDKLTLAQASQFAQMGRLAFQHLLSSRGICVHYDVEDFGEDLKTLQELK